MAQTKQGLSFLDRFLTLWILWPWPLESVEGYRKAREKIN